MKNTLLFIIFFAVLGICCKKDPLPPPPPVKEEPVIELGKMSVKRNGVLWTIKPTIFSTNDTWTKQNSIVLRYDKINPNGLDEYMYFKDIPEIVGKYKFEYARYFSFGNDIPEFSMEYLLDGDQLFGSIHVDTSRKDNYLEIIRYDSTENIIEGKFEVHLKDYKMTHPSVIPSKLDLTEGKFHLKIKQ